MQSDIFGPGVGLLGIAVGEPLTGETGDGEATGDGPGVERGDAVGETAGLARLKVGVGLSTSDGDGLALWAMRVAAGSTSHAVSARMMIRSRDMTVGMLSRPGYLSTDTDLATFRTEPASLDTSKTAHAF